MKNATNSFGQKHHFGERNRGVWHEIIFWLMMESQVLLFKNLSVVHRAHQALGQNFNL